MKITKDGLDLHDEFKAVKKANREQEKKVKVCQACGYPIDKDGFCTAPLSAAD